MHRLHNKMAASVTSMHTVYVLCMWTYREHQAVEKNVFHSYVRHLQKREETNSFYETLHNTCCFYLT